MECNECNSINVTIVEFYYDGDDQFDCLVKCDDCGHCEWLTLSEEELPKEVK